MDMQLSGGRLRLENEKFQTIVLEQIVAIRGQQGTMSEQIGTIRGQQGTMFEQIGAIREQQGTMREQMGAMHEQLVKVTEGLTELRNETRQRFSDIDGKLEYLLKKSIQTDLEIIKLKRA